jgi:hypothetical protein
MPRPPRLSSQPRTEECVLARSDLMLDAALEQTFPASDPIGALSIS